MSPKCKHWLDAGIVGGGACGNPKSSRHGQTISYGVCLTQCGDYEGPLRGNGDLIKRVVGFATAGLVKPCGGCLERQRRYNLRQAEAAAMRLHAAEGAD